MMPTLQRKDQQVCKNIPVDTSQTTFIFSGPLGFPGNTVDKELPTNEPVDCVRDGKDHTARYKWDPRERDSRMGINGPM